jgi:hypothetical protein
MTIAAERDPLKTFDWTEFESVSNAVATAVATVSDDDVRAIDQLYETVDPDSLNHLFASATRSRNRSNGRIEFEHHGYLLVVKANGRGHVYDTQPSQVH